MDVSRRRDDNYAPIDIEEYDVTAGSTYSRMSWSGEATPMVTYMTIVVWTIAVLTTT